jgi:hypothetical protein
VEVKYLAPNDHRRVANWRPYVEGEAFRDPAKATASGLYELVRNWRMAHDLADGRPFVLVNLAPAATLDTTPSIDQFKASLGASARGRFELLTWGLFRTTVERECGGLPPWLDAYLRRQRLT